MVRTKLYAALVAGSMMGFLSVSGEARAQGLEPYMWGAGPKLGTIIVPGRYPFAFPTKVENYDFIENGAQAGNPNADDEKRDLDANGDPRFSTLNGAGFDLRLGGEGFFGIDAQNRIGAGVGLGLGGRYTDAWFTLNYDRVLYSTDSFSFIVGPQAGFGYARWGGDPDEGGANEAYRINYFPIRGRAGIQFLNKTQLYGLGIFAGTAVPGNTTYIDLDGNPQEAVGGPGNFALHLHAGLEIDVQFGDFVPPKKGGKGGKGDAGKAKGGKGGKGDAGKAKGGKGGKGKLTGAEELDGVVQATRRGAPGTNGEAFLLLPPAGLLLLGFRLRRKKL